MSPVISGGSSGGAISGVTVTGTAVSGQVPVASSGTAGAWGYPPGFEIGYDSKNLSVNIVSTTEATPTTFMTAASHTFDGTLVMVEFFSPGVVTPGVALSSTTVVLFESTTEITQLGVVAGNSTASAIEAPFYARYRFTPTAGSHTYIIGGFIAPSGTGSITAGTGSGSNAPNAFLRFTKV